jgi:hypothetical protein
LFFPESNFERVFEKYQCVLVVSGRCFGSKTFSGVF